jgi:hypothetical protein
MVEEFPSLQFRRTNLILVRLWKSCGFRRFLFKKSFTHVVLHPVVSVEIRRSSLWVKDLATATAEVSQRPNPRSDIHKRRDSPGIKPLAQLGFRICWVIC